jgi:hypothetical protein
MWLFEWCGELHCGFVAAMVDEMCLFGGVVELVAGLLR